CKAGENARRETRARSGSGGRHHGTEVGVCGPDGHSDHGCEPYADAERQSSADVEKHRSREGERTLLWTVQERLQGIRRRERWNRRPTLSWKQVDLCSRRDRRSRGKKADKRRYRENQDDDV